MRCNLFRPIGAGDNRMGTFLMFSQYTEDITKEQSEKSTYRVVPSKFVALNLNLEQLLEHTKYNDRNVSAWIPDRGDDLTFSLVDASGTLVEGVDNIIPQIFQSNFENGVSYIKNYIQRNITNGEPDLSINPHGYMDWNIEGREFSSELLWHMLQDWGLITRILPSNPTNGTPEDDRFEYFDEVKYIGDINIHSNHKVGSYSYDEIFCHIPARADEYYYRLNNEIPEEDFKVPTDNPNPNIFTRNLEEWTSTNWPINMQLANEALTFHAQNPQVEYVYRVGGCLPEFDFRVTPPVPRHVNNEENIEYKFNAIIVFYDVLYCEPGDDPQYLHRNRPMGIYLCGPVKLDDNSREEIELQNTFTKYVTNNDAFGQGAAFGLRIMTRYTPTPNSSTYTMGVDTQGGDYETITQAMGGIADAISGINRLGRDQRSMFQAYKDHLAMFRNRRVNVPYPREVDGRMYWFVNGRNTGQPCSVEVPEPTPSTEVEVDINIIGEGTIDVVPFVNVVDFIQNTEPQEVEVEFTQNYL